MAESVVEFPPILLYFCTFKMADVNHSIANSSLFPTFLYLHSNSTQILALKKMVFLKKKNLSKKKFFFFLPFFYATFQCGRYGIIKKKFKYFFDPENWKNGPQKLLIIGPDPFISQSSPDQRPTAQNWFFILWVLGTDLWTCDFILRGLQIRYNETVNFF